MQPMQLHWVPHPWVPRVAVVGQVVHFLQILLALENCIKVYNLIVSKSLFRLN